MKVLYRSVFSVALVGSFISVQGNNEPIHTHKKPPINVPSIVDGTPFGINGAEIKKLIFIIREVEKLVYGVANPVTKLRRGMYLFMDEPFSIATFAEYELENAPLPPKVAREVQVLFKTVIEDFIKIAAPFIEQAHGVKAITLGFMKEWAEKHDRESSSLLDWAREKDGHEFDTFRRETNTFKKLYRFCQDLVSFLSDLIQSCPRGWQQFLVLQKKVKK